MESKGLYGALIPSCRHHHGHFWIFAGPDSVEDVVSYQAAAQSCHATLPRGGVICQRADAGGPKTIDCS